MQFIGTAKDGKAEWDLPGKREEYLRTIEGKRIKEDLRKFHKTRTLPQMGYYWGYVVPIAAAWMGYPRNEEEQCHWALKYMFLLAVDERGHKYVPSLSALVKDPMNTKIMAWFVDQVRDFVAREYGYAIADPDKAQPRKINDIVMEIYAAAA